MKQKLARIQGTDGIRGRVDFQEKYGEQEPLEVFLEHGVLTECFFELYVYCYCRQLIDENYASIQDQIVIGWDPRDASGVFPQSAIRGAEKAGMNVYSIGILPTPAIAQYVLEINAKAGFMLTASHNPSDQNGIKIFLGTTGLKLFPADDIRLTQKIIDTPYSKIQTIKYEKREINHHDVAKEKYVATLFFKENLWKENACFPTTHLVVDVANGALYEVIHDICKHLQVEEITILNDDLKKGINVDSGVADLEGIHIIQQQDILDEGIFVNHQAIQELFRQGRVHQEECRQGKSFCTGWVFDGDGDRFYRLDYHPWQDAIYVSSGDFSIYWQLQYILSQHSVQNPLFVNTVESDIEVSRAIQKLDVETHQTAVGDKWILWLAIYHSWKNRIEKLMPTHGSTKLQILYQDWKNTIEEMKESMSFDALVFTKQCEKILKYLPKHEQSSSIGFIAGSEVSGHSITKSWSRDSQQELYSGNGVKSALNTQVAIQALLEKLKPEEYFEHLIQPYPRGIDISFPIYYVNQSLLEPKQKFRVDIAKYVNQVFIVNWLQVQLIEHNRPEEPQMLFWEIHEADSVIGTIFIRNSGTEDKLSLYFRGREKDKNIIQKISEQIYLYLLPRVKNAQEKKAQIEKKILQQISKERIEEITVDANSPISATRLIHEMQNKQKLIFRQNHFYYLTERGKALL